MKFILRHLRTIIALSFFTVPMLTSCHKEADTTLKGTQTVPKTSINKNIKQYETKEYIDVTYKKIGTEELKLDLYLPTVRMYDKNPVVIYYHGGSFVGGDKQGDFLFMLPVINKLRDNGYAVVSVNYRLATDKIKFPLPVEDCVDAVRYLVKNSGKYDIDIEKMGSWGISAGGYMSLMTAYAGDNFKGDAELSEYKYNLKFTVDMCGPAVFDAKYLKDISNEAHMTINYFVGSDIRENPKLFKKASPSEYIKNKTLRLLIIHGKKDQLVPLKQSELIYNMAQENKTEAKIIKIDNALHTFGSADGGPISPDINTIYNEIAEFILKS